MKECDILGEGQGVLHIFRRGQDPITPMIYATGVGQKLCDGELS